MYINEYEFGKANFESVKKVAEHFNNVGSNCCATADEMGVSGSFMMSLVNRGAVKIVGKKEIFVCIDERQNLYRKYDANMYALTITASDFWKMYVRGVERRCNEMKSGAENYISTAKQKLTEVENLLTKVGTVRI